MHDINKEKNLREKEISKLKAILTKKEDEKIHLSLHNSDGVIESFIVVVEKRIVGLETFQSSHTQNP
jgi:hypothetical protein